MLYARRRRHRNGVCAAAKRHRAASAHNADLHSHGAADAGSVWSGGVAPGYFCPPQDPKFDDEGLKSLALAHVRNLKIFAEFLGNDELLKILDEIKSARVQESSDLADHEGGLADALCGASGL